MRPHSLPTRLRLLALGLVGWTVIGLVFALPAVAAGNDASRVLLGSLAQWWSWGVLAVAIVTTDRRLPISPQRMGRRLLAHLPLSVVFTVLHLYLLVAVRGVLGLGAIQDAFSPLVLTTAFRGMILWSWLVYWLIVGAWMARTYHARFVASELQVARMERLSTEARLHALRLQLDPHFLFNALNTISSHVDRDPKLARRMIEHLGDLLRASLDGAPAPLVPLATELVVLDHYLAIQRIRFGDRVRIAQRIDPEAHRALVPPLVVQPLVENAIRHGLSPRASGGTVTVTATRAGNLLRLSVEDDGVGLAVPGGAPAGVGLGLSITRQRLEGLYPGGGVSLALRSRPAGGTVAEVVVPFAEAHASALESSIA